jgi:hypothetical protein
MSKDGNRAIPPTGKDSKAAKTLKRAIDKSDRKEPPTVGKPVIVHPSSDSKSDRG